MVLLTREQLEDRLAALHRASMELVSNLSLDTVLERIVELAREQVGARYAALGVVNEEGELIRFIPVGMDEEGIQKISNHPEGLGLLGLFHKEKKVIRVEDISKDSRHQGFPKHHPKMRSFLGVPILSGDQPLGQIYLADKLEGDSFNEQDERVIETLAAYAAIAITNAKLYEAMLERDEALSKRNEDLALLNDVATALTETQYIEDILEKTLTRVMTYLEVEAGEIFLRDDSENELRMALHRGEAPDAFWTRNHFRLGEGAIGIAAETRQPLVNIDPSKDTRYLRKAVVDAGFRCIASIPLLAQDQVVGVMSVATRDARNLEEREVQLLMAIGAWSGLTIENARLNRQARRLAILEERERIGMDLHDGIIQSIYGVGLALDYARMAIDEDPRVARAKIEESIVGLNKTIRDIRAYILDLRPRQFGGEDLKQGLQRLIEEFRANTDAEAILNGPENGLVNLPTSNARALFHICQEALANVARHSEANYAEVRLWTVRDRVLLEVSDDGVGFDLRKMSVTLGHGLSNMHTRARKVGGDVEITSTPGRGTTVLAWVPRN